MDGASWNAIFELPVAANIIAGKPLRVLGFDYYVCRDPGSANAMG